jgi:hypothetical protein
MGINQENTGRRGRFNSGVACFAKNYFIDTAM